MKAIIIDQSLQGPLGHHLEYTLAARDAFASAGLNPIILCHIDCEQNTAQKYNLQPWFYEHWTQKKGTLLSLVWCTLRCLGLHLFLPMPTHSFGQDLKRALTASPLSENDHVFIHTLNFIQLLQTAQIATQMNCMAKFHIVLRQDPYESPRRGLKKILLKLIFSAVRKSSRFFFYSDTKSLCRAYEIETGLPFKLLPVLFDPSSFQRIARRSCSERLELTFLGDGRREKGFDLLPEIVESTLAKSTKAYFKLQAFLTPASKADGLLFLALKKLRILAQQHPDRVRLIEQPLSQAEYIEMLLASDAVLLPYDLHAYKLRSSGILTQTIAAGKVAILPMATSLAAEVPKAMSVTYTHVQDIALLINDLANNYPDDFIRNHAAQSFCHEHSQQKFMQALNI